MKLKSTLVLSLVLATIQIPAFAGDGSNGRSQIITAEGPVSINLSGGDGSNGRRGSDGSRGKCGTRRDSNGRTVRDDRRGGNGGRGGSGGDGGNGGNLTVLFNKLEEVAGIHFVSIGGDGGSGGAGGEGGYGCPRGSDGSRGSSGSDGRNGNLYLVGKEFQPYQKDTSREYNSISSLMNGKNIVKQIWAGIDGSSLIAPGSRFGSSYVLQGYQYGTAQVVLKDATKIDPRLLESGFTVTMNEGVTKIDAGSEYKIIARHSADSANAVLEIDRLYFAHEFDSIGFETVVTKNGNRYVQLTTDKNLVPHPSLTMNLKVEVKGRWFKYREIFNGEVPASMIEAVDAAYLVDLDALPLSKKIGSNDKIRLTMSYKLQEQELAYSAEETWVVKLNGAESPEQELFIEE